MNHPFHFISFSYRYMHSLQKIFRTKMGDYFDYLKGGGIFSIFCVFIFPVFFGKNWQNKGIFFCFIFPYFNVISKWFQNFFVYALLRRLFISLFFYLFNILKFYLCPFYMRVWVQRKTGFRKIMNKDFQQISLSFFLKREFMYGEVSLNQRVSPFYRSLKENLEKIK